MDATKEKNVVKLNSTVYLFLAMFEYFIAILTSGAYLAKLTTTIGISDAMTAILSSITSLAAMFQVFSIFLAHKTPVKRWIIPMTTMSQMLVAILYLIPFLKVGSFAPFLFFIIILINNASINIAYPIKSNWFISPIEPRKRGSFQATISIVSIIGATIFTFFVGFSIDKYEAAGKLSTMFVILTTVIFVLAVMQVLCLLITKETILNPTKKESPLKSVKTVINNKMFIRFLILDLLWAVANNFTTPFLFTYQIKELGFSMSFISTVTIIMNFVNVLVLYCVGKFSEKHTYSSLLFTSFVFGFLGFVIIIFTMPVNGNVMFTLHRLFSLFNAAIYGVSVTSLLFSIVEQGHRAVAFAFKSIITGIFGFAATLLATPLFSALQSASVTILEHRVFAQQILATISTFITLVIIMYYCKFLRSIRNCENKENT